MLLALLLSLAPAVTQADNPASLPPPVTVQLNHDQFSRGDRARVYVTAAQDGYLVVLHADPEGRVRVLFPLDPRDNAFVGGGRRQELRGRSDRDAFTVEDEDGAGTVLAAVSQSPFSVDTFVRNDHWDYRALGGPSLKDDPLAGLVDIVRAMSGPSPFDFDAATYVVSRQLASRYGYGYGNGYGYPHGSRIGLSFGYPYRYGYDPFYNPFYDPFCTDPFWGWSVRCDRYGFGYSFYRPRRYGFGTTFGGFARGGAGRSGPRFVIPDGRGRYTPVEARPRVRDLGTTSRGSEPRWDGGSVRPEARPRSAKPSVSRGSGGSRPAPRPAARPAPRPSGGRRH